MNKGMNRRVRRTPKKKNLLGSAAGLVFLSASLVIFIIIGILLVNRSGTEPPVEGEEKSEFHVLMNFPTAKPDLPNEAEISIEQPLLAMPETVQSKCAILFKTETGESISEKNADTRTFPASITKIMTVLVAIENIDDPYTEETTLSQGMFDYLLEQNASVAGFRAGETVKAIDLMYAALLPSGADGSIGLAELVAGSEADFVGLMNAKALEIGMVATHFSNVTGLHLDNHYTTVRDLSILLTYAMKNDTFREIITTDYYTTNPTNFNRYGISFSSTVFTSMRQASCVIDCVKGGKTGFTTEAGLCLATIAEIDGVEYALITTGAGDGSNEEKLNVYDARSIYAILQ